MQFRLWHTLVLLLLASILIGCASTRKKIYASVKGESRNQTPFKVADNLYYVGTADIAVFLIKTNDGLILIDTAYDHLHDKIISNINNLGLILDDEGLKPDNIKIILNTHAHMDHAGGIERMRLATKAEVIAPLEAAKELKAGSKKDFSILTRIMPFTPVEKITVLDETYIEHGGTRLDWHHTPGHTKGCTSWSFTHNVEEQERRVLLVCGFTLLPLTRFSKRYSEILSDYRTSFDLLDNLQNDCDILLSPHLGHFKTEKTLTSLQNGEYVFDEEGCKKLLSEELKGLSARVEKLSRK